MALTITPYAGQGWVNESAPDLSAETLTSVDEGITTNSDAINAIANAVVNQITNDPDKIASIQALFAYKQVTDQAITELNSDLGDLSNNLIREIADDVEHAETVYSLFKNNVPIFGEFRILIYHFRIADNADPNFGIGYYTAQITRLNGVYTAVITSSWSGDVWNMIFTDYDNNSYIKKLS